MPHAIVSYDGTRNDRDALALGHLLFLAGASLTLAYVRHAPEADAEREADAQHGAERLLAAGAGLLDDGEVAQRVVFNASTAEGLSALAAETDADLIVFGSGYRTPSGHVGLPHTAEQLLDVQAACSLAVAPAGLRREPVERSIGSVRVYDEDGDLAARATADSLAHALGASVTAEDADLLVLASREGAANGHVALSATARELFDEATCPVLALARGAALAFA